MRETADNDAASKQFYKRLLDDRNIGMADKIAQMAQRGEKVFVVVGEHSVVELLAKQGWQVRQVSY